MESRVCFTEQIEGHRETKSFVEPKSHKEVPESNFMFLVELKKKVMSFRDIMDLPPCNGSLPIREMLMMTNEELHRLYPEVVPSVPIPEMNEMSMHQGLKHFYNALTSIGDSWVKNHKRLAKFEYKESGEMKNIDSVGFGGRVLEKLAYMIKMARELFDELEDKGKNNDKSPGASKFEEILNGSCSNNDNGSFCHSPLTPNSVLPELSNISAKSGEFAYSPTLTRPFRSSVRRLIPIDLNRLLVFPLLPHLSTPGSKTMNKGSKATEESGLETQEVKSNSMAKSNPATKEESGDGIAAYETKQITVSSSNQISSNYGDSSNSYTTPKMGGNPVLTLSVAESGSSVQSPQLKPSMLLSNVSQAPPPPQPLSAKAKPNVSLAAVAPPWQTQMALLPNVSTQLPRPPPLPKFLPNMCVWLHVACVVVWPCAQLLACVSTWPRARLCGWLHGPVHGYGHGRMALLCTQSHALAAWPGAWLHCPHGWLQAWLHISTHGCEHQSSSPRMIATMAASPAIASPPSSQPSTPQSTPLPKNLSVPSPVQPLTPNTIETSALILSLPPPISPSKGLLPSPHPSLPLKNERAPPTPSTKALLPNAPESSALAPPSSVHSSKGSLSSPPLPLLLKNGGAPFPTPAQPLPTPPPLPLKNGGAPPPAQSLPTLPPIAIETSASAPAPAPAPPLPTRPSKGSLELPPPPLPLNNRGSLTPPPAQLFPSLPLLTTETSTPASPPPTLPSKGPVPSPPHPLSPKSGRTPTPPLAQPLFTWPPNATETSAPTPPSPTHPTKGLLPLPPPPLPLKSEGATLPPPAQQLHTIPPIPIENSAPAPAPAPAPPSPTHISKGSLQSPPPLLPLKKEGAPPPPPSKALSTAETSAQNPPPPTRPSKGPLATPPPPLPLKNGGAPARPTTQPLPALPPNATGPGPAPTPTPPPPSHPSIGSLPSPPPPLSLKNGGAPPPPPPVGGTKGLGLKKSNTKLKRSSFMGNLYRVLKGKVEGSGTDSKSSHGRKTQIGGSAGGKKGMADALAEMTKRSTYFQQIEEDVKRHATMIMELKKTINSFQTKDMAELLKFHQYVEHHLENLTDETQVLARFEDFPTRKLETLRMAAALYSRLHEIVTTLKSWKMVNPLGQLLDRVESYFNKIKVEVDALERIKDEESKKFKSCNIHFDFDIILRIKELIVDISSGCMELALKERREAKAIITRENGSKTDAQLKAYIKMLWRAFQLAFRIYTFAGGQDDRADRLSRELALEIELE